MRLSSNPVPLDIEIKLNEFSKELKEINVAYVGHGVVSLDGHHTGYFSSKKWGNAYISEGFFFQEPILDFFDKTQVYEVHWSFIENCPLSHLRKKEVNIIGGITLCKTKDNHRNFLNLGFKRAINTTEFLLSYLKLLQAYEEAFAEIHTTWRSRC